MIHQEDQQKLNKAGDTRGLKLKHGLAYHPLYKRWHSMIARCYDETRDSFEYYGARGINVCERWHDIKNFINDMFPTWKEGLQLDRIDNNGNYESSNCRWVTVSQNAKNRRNKATKQSDVDRVVNNGGNWYVYVPFKTKEEAENFARLIKPTNR